MTDSILERMARQERLHDSEPPTVEDELRSAWWSMVPVIDDLRSEMNSELMTRAFDKTTAAGEVEDERHAAYLQALNELFQVLGHMKDAIEIAVAARRELIEWRVQDPTEDDRF